ncbi:MAG: putative HELicase Q, partial [Streblomastix strix]
PYQDPLLGPLLQCLWKGVAFHHSGIPQEWRTLIEKAHRHRVINITCCTTTLSAGVNLPARRVVIKSPYSGRNPLTPALYKQMAGRAGRAGLDTEGDVVMIFKDRSQAVNVRRYVVNASCERVESQMLGWGQIVEEKVEKEVEIDLNKLKNKNKKDKEKEKANQDDIKKDTVQIVEVHKAVAMYNVINIIKRTLMSHQIDLILKDQRVIEQEIQKEKERLMKERKKKMMRKEEKGKQIGKQEMMKDQESENEGLFIDFRQQKKKTLMMKDEENKNTNINIKEESESITEQNSLEQNSAPLEDVEKEYQFDQQDFKKKIKKEVIPGVFTLKHSQSINDPIPAIVENTLLCLSHFGLIEYNQDNNDEIIANEIKRKIKEQEEQLNGMKEKDINLTNKGQQIEKEKVMIKDEVKEEEEIKKDEINCEILQIKPLNQPPQHQQIIHPTLFDTITSTPIGQAAFKAGLAIEISLAVSNQLIKASDSMCLSDDLHAFFLAVPLQDSGSDSLNMQWRKFEQIFQMLSSLRQDIARRIGIDEGLIKRFFSALVLSDLANEVPLSEICIKYDIKSGAIQSLAFSSAISAQMLAAFAKRMGWSGMEAVLSLLAQRLNVNGGSGGGMGIGGVKPELVPLTSLEGVGPARARVLHKFGFRTVEIISKTDPQELASALPEKVLGLNSLNIAKRIVLSAQKLLHKELSEQIGEMKEKEEKLEELQKLNSEMRKKELVKEEIKAGKGLTMQIWKNDNSNSSDKSKAVKMDNATFTATSLFNMKYEEKKKEEELMKEMMNEGGQIISPLIQQNTQGLKQQQKIVVKIKMPKFQDYEVIRRLKGGAQGKTFLVKLKKNGTLYVMKRVDYLEEEDKKTADEEVAQMKLFESRFTI